MSLQNPTITRQRFKVTNFSKTSGIVAGTPFEVFHLYNVRILSILIYQTNTTPQANNLDHDFTVDGETIEGNNIQLLNNTINWLYMENIGISPAMGENPYVNATTDEVGFDLNSFRAGVGYSGRNLTFADILYMVNFDTIGANQEFYVDIWYEQLEAS